MPPVRKILIADPDASTVRALAPALRQRGYQVHAARDGTRALQVAILRFPDVILLDDKTPLLDPRTFMRILRTNPRTERIPVILTGETPDADRLRLGIFIKKPFRPEDVLARIEQIFRRVETSRAVAGESREIEGNLAQIPLVDLLQILAVNRKTGRLTVERDGEGAEVCLREGRVVDATMGAVQGEKALWRLLGHTDGQFAFVPGNVPPEDRIERKLEELVLEGLRQVDEVARLSSQLPPPEDHIELLLAPSELPAGLHPVTEEVVALLKGPRAFREIVDCCKGSDLEAIRAVLALLERGYARCRRGPPPPKESGAFLEAHELHLLRQRISRGRSSGAQTIGKVILAGGGPLARRAALARFAAMSGFEVKSEAPAGFGTLGRLVLDGVSVDVIEIPGEPALAPLRAPFSAGALGVLVLLPADEDEELLAELSKERHLPLAVCGPSDNAIPASLKQAPGGVLFGGPDAADALHLLLSSPMARGADADAAA